MNTNPDEKKDNRYDLIDPFGTNGQENTESKESDRPSEFGSSDSDKIFFDTSDIKKGGKKKKIVFWSLFILGSIIALSSGFLFNLIFSPKGDDLLNIDIKSEESILAGQEFDLNLDIGNKSDRKLENVTLFLTGSHGIKPVNSSKELEGRGVLISEIGPKGNYDLTLSFTPESDGEKEIKFRAEYNILGSALKYRSVFSHMVNISSLDVEFKLVNTLGGSIGPNPVTLQGFDEPFEGEFVVTNNTGELLENLSITIEPEESDIEITLNEEFSSISPKETIRIPFSVKLPDFGEYSIKYIVKDTIGREIFKKTAEINILETRVNMQLTVNDQAESLTVNLGEEVDFNFTVQNQGTRDLKNVKAVFIASEFLNLSTLSSVNSDPVNGRTIEFTSLKNPRFNNLKAETSDEVEINFSMDMVENVLGSTEESSFIAEVKLIDTNNNVIGQSNQVQINVNSDIELSTNSAYYFRPDSSLPDNYGPFPPEVGKKTSFLVLWEIERGFAPTGKTVVATRLPSGVRFISGDTNQGNITYNSQQRIVSWNIGSTDQFDDNQETLSGFFTVEIQPTLSDVGQAFPLVLEVNLGAIDKFTEKEISKVYKGHSSDVEDDLVAKSQGINGRVVEVAADNNPGSNPQNNNTGNENTNTNAAGSINNNEPESSVQNNNSDLNNINLYQKIRRGLC